MNIFLIGDFNSIYMYEYVKSVLLDENMDYNYFCFHDSPTQINENYRRVYESNNIVLFNIQTKWKIVYRFDKFLKLYRKYKFRKILSSLKVINNLHLHFVKLEYFEIIQKYRKNIDNLILTFWGSDLLRLKADKEDQMYRFLRLADHIVVGPLNMERVFEKKFGDEFKNKLAYAIFGTPVLKNIKKVKNEKKREGILEKFQLPVDKHIITCGYNGKCTQQHNLIIEAICSCNKSIKDKIFVILPAGYGYQKTYFDNIENMLMEARVNYIVDNSFYGIEDISELRVASDIFIHAQITDGFSSSVVEYLYADNVLINGDWIDYPILEKNNVYYLKFSSIKDLSKKIEYVVNNIEIEREKVRKTNGILYKIRSWDFVKKSWQELYV